MVFRQPRVEHFVHPLEIVKRGVHKVLDERVVLRAHSIRSTF
jgi:hypothetical protein